MEFKKLLEESIRLLKSGSLTDDEFFDHFKDLPNFKTKEEMFERWKVLVNHNRKG